MSQSSRHALRNTQVSRSTVSKNIKVLDGSINESIVRSTVQPDTLYIEMLTFNMVAIKYALVQLFMKDMKKICKKKKA